MNVTTGAILVTCVLSLITSSLTLAAVIYGGKQVQQQVEQAKTKADDFAKKTKAFLASLEEN